MSTGQPGEPGSSGRENVETAQRAGAVLLAMVIPEDADPAMLTGVIVDTPESWDADAADSLRYSLEDGGPDVRQTGVLDTPLGPAVLAHRVPGVEQARARRPLALQLQAFLTEPGSGRMLLLTLSGPSAAGWEVHQKLFAELVASASPSRPTPADPEDSFEQHTYRA